MSYQKVRQAITTSASTLLQASPISILSANIISGNMPSPKANVKWAQWLFTTRSVATDTLGYRGKDKLTGVLFVNIRIPLDSGEKDGLVAVDAFRSALPTGTRLTFEGQEVTVLSIGAVDGRVVDGFWRTDITIPFQAFITRS